MHFTAIAVACSLILGSFVSARPSEEERIRLWKNDKANTWPPKWQPESEAFKIAMEKREDELLMLPGADERWENFVQYTQSRMVPRFTEKGFKVIQTPAHVHAKLRNALEAGLNRWDNLRHERQIDAVYTPLPSKFIDLHGLDWEVIQDLQSIHEDWSGLELRPTSAYGLRLYQNGSALTMHYDKTNTHVISAIIHVGHEYDDDNHPWPIEIEDHDGKLHAVNLEPGQMLFYESAACLHGRRQIFRGKYYASIFVHYQPVDKSVWDYDVEQIIAKVPPHWRENVVEDHGNRWSGMGITTDSRVTAGAPPRMIQGELVPDLKAYYARVRGPNYRKFTWRNTRPSIPVEVEVEGREEL